MFLVIKLKEVSVVELLFGLAVLTLYGLIILLVFVVLKLLSVVQEIQVAVEPLLKKEE